MIRIFLFTLCCALGLPLAAAAQNYNIQNIARLDILPGYPTQNGHMIAARIQLREGWKTYWRAPGGDGIPPIFNWSGSRNIGAVAFHWPEPTIFDERGVRTIGYKNELILPISITSRKPGAPMTAKGEVMFGVCEDVCIPIKARFSMDIAGTDQASRTAIRTALAQQAVTAKSAGLRNIRCKITPIEDGFHIVATLQSGASLPQSMISVFEFPHPDVWVEQAGTKTSGRVVTARANLYAYGDAPLIVDRSKITLTLLGGTRAIEQRGCPS